MLGSEGGSYYADERKLTLENAAAVKRCIQQQGLAAIGEIIKISQSRRAPKVGPPLFALAMASTHDDEETRKFALHYLPKVARTGSHLQLG